MKRWLKSPKEIVAISRKRIDLIIVVAFAVITALIRIPCLGYSSLWWDEAAQVLAADGVLRYAYPSLPTGFLYIHGPLCSYLMAFSFMLFGTSEFSARLVSLIFSSLTLPIVYLLGKALGDRRSGAVGTAIVAFSPWAVAWARQARMYAQFQFFYLLTIYIFYKGYVTQNRPQQPFRYSILLFVSFLGALFSHELAVTLIPSLFAYLLVTRGFKWIRCRDLVIGAIVLGFLFLAFFFVTRLGGMWTPKLTVKPSWLKYNLLRSYEPFYARYPVLSLFTVLGASVLLMQRDKNLLYLYTNFLIPLHLVPITVASLTDVFGTEVFERYLFFLFPIFVLAASFSLLQHIDSVSEVIAKKFGGTVIHLNKDTFKNLATWVILLILVFPVVSNLYVRILIPDSPISLTEAFSYYQPGHPGPWIDIEYGGFRVACGFVEQRHQNGDAIITTQHLPTYYYLQEIISERNASLFFLMQQRGAWTKDFYLNCTIVNTLDELKEVLYHHKRVWIIIDDRFIRLYAHPYEVVSFIFDNTERAYENREEYIQVYLWS